MKILKVYPENLIESKKALYKLTKAQAVSMKNADDSVKYKPEAWCLYEDENANGEVREVLSMIVDNGDVLSTVSQTFKREFFDIVDIMGEEDYEIVIKKGRSKNGREFVTCEMVCE